MNKPGEIKKISEREFTLLTELIQRVSGIHLTSSKKDLLVNRLSFRLRALKLCSFAAYYQLLLEDEKGEEHVHLIDRISTNETSFFREPRQWELIEKTMIPTWQREALEGKRKREIRIWSAGCSTGEEPYSIAMLLLQRCPIDEGWKIDILATDISDRVLRKAEAGLWNIEQSREIPSPLVKRFMLKGHGGQEGKMKVGTEIRSAVRFEQLNLNDANYPIHDTFDLIFCRNVLIYFDQKSGLQVIHRLLDRLDPKGLLLLGHAESLLGRTDRVRSVIPTVYAFNPKEKSSVLENQRRILAQPGKRIEVSP